MNLSASVRLCFGVGFCAISLSVSAHASLIYNGDFETGDLTGWTVTDSADSGGSFFAVSDVVTPLAGSPTVGPFQGTYYAVSDAFNPGSHALTQAFTTPSNLLSLVLSVEIFVNDQFGGSGLGGEIDILAAGADPLAGTPLAVLYTADTAVIDGTPNPYVLLSTDIAPYLEPGTSYQLRILESDSIGPINVGVDNISLTITPEPATRIPVFVLSGLSILVARRRSRA